MAATGGETASVGTALLQGLELSGLARLADGWTLGGEYTWTQSEVTTSDVQGIREGDPLFGATAQGASEALGDFQGYSLFNLGAGYRISDRFQLNATVENPLDRGFVEYRHYPLRNDPGVTAFSNVYNNILEPRRLWLVVRATL